MFEAKDLYREMTGGGHRIHASNNHSETLRDAVLIFGDELPEAKEPDHVLCRDLTGANSWASLKEMFSVMNVCAKYVVLRNFDTLPDKHDTKLHGDIDILCTDHREFALLANAQKVFPQAYRRLYTVKVQGVDVALDIRDDKEQYYCSRWSLNIIRHRVLVRGLYTPSEEDYLHSLAYHVLMHKRTMASDYGGKLVPMLSGSDGSDPACSHLGYVAEKLEFFMSENGYRFVRPVDWSVYFNHEKSLELGSSLWRLVSAPPTTLKHFFREVRAIFSALYRHRIKSAAGGKRDAKFKRSYVMGESRASRSFSAMRFAALVALNDLQAISAGVWPRAKFLGLAWCDPSDIGLSTRYFISKKGGYLHSNSELSAESLGKHRNRFIVSGDWDKHTSPIEDVKHILRTLERFKYQRDWASVGRCHG
ncbi:MAG: hypothetical protein R3E54_01475 [Halioglobus sp.]